MHAPWTVSIIGGLAGAAIALSLMAGSPVSEHIGIGQFFVWIALGMVGGSLILFSLRSTLLRLIEFSTLAIKVKSTYKSFDSFSYLTFLLFFSFSAGIELQKLYILYILSIFLCLNLATLLIIIFVHEFSKPELPYRTITAFFFASGFSALIYQIAWQRMLFTTFGSDIESVTLIVSVFMFGIGIGSLAGGIISEQFSWKLPAIFAAIEIMIGLFGFLSIELINLAGEFAIDFSKPALTITIYGVLLFPTLCMGATLPILVAYLLPHLRYIGKAVGTLYSINTLGSAAACIVTAEILFVFFGLKGTVLAAALLNILVGICLYILVSNYSKENEKHVTTTQKNPLRES